MTYLLFSRDFDIFWKCVLVEIFGEKFFERKEGLSENLDLGAVSKYIEMPTNKHIRHVIRKEDFEITESFHDWNLD